MREATPADRASTMLLEIAGRIMPFAFDESQ